MMGTNPIENKGVLLFLFVLLMYYVWMDLALYFHIQSTPSAEVPPQSAQSLGTAPQVQTSDKHYFSPFYGLTMKVMMLDHTSHYVFSVATMIFERATHFSEVFYFISPNMISAFGIVVAAFGAKLVSSEHLLSRQFGVLMYECRALLDVLDGVVARARAHEVSNMSHFGSYGYYFDGFADLLGMLTLAVGLTCYFKRLLMNGKAYVPLPIWNNKCTAGFSPQHSAKNEGSMGGSLPAHLASATFRRILIVVVCYGLQMVMSSFFWDRYIAGYHHLLESPPSSMQQALLQNEVLKSSLMWIVIWFWKIANVLAMSQFILLAIFLDRSWEYLTWMQYIGFIGLISLATVTEIHYNMVSTYVGTALNSVAQTSAIISGR